MAIYRGIDGVNKVVKKQYVGIDGVNRAINRKYVEKDGVVRTVSFYVKKDRLDLVKRKESLGYGLVIANIAYDGYGYNSDSVSYLTTGYYKVTTRQSKVANIGAVRKDVDVTNYGRVKYTISSSTGVIPAKYVYLKVVRYSYGSYYTSLRKVITQDVTEDEMTITLDIPNLIGNQRPAVMIKSDEDAVYNLCVHEIWLE